MIDLPEKFFFVLDAHQASVAIAIFSMLLVVFSSLVVGNVYVAVMDSDLLKQIINHNDEEARNIIRVLPTIILWTALTICIFSLAIDLMLLLGVLKRKPCLLLPWMIIQVLTMIGAFGSMIHEFTMELTLGSVVLNLLFFAFNMAWLSYEFFAVYASRQLLGTTSVPSRVAVC